MSTTALLVIDLQVALTEAAYQREAVLANVAQIIAKARAAVVPVVYMQHEEEAYPPLNYGASGWQIDPAVAPEQGDLTIRKRASDSFYHTSLQQELEQLGVQQLVVTGMATEFCVDTTCRRASSLGYHVTLVADGHTTDEEGVLPPEQVIEHHNGLLAALAQPNFPIEVQPAAEIAFVG